MDKMQENIWKLENIALEQDFFSLEYAAKKLNLTERRTFDILKKIKHYKILKEYNLPKKRGRPIKLYRLSLKDLQQDKSKELFEYIDKIKDKADSIILFGSLTTKFADAYSDVDLFVLSKRSIPKADNIEILKTDDMSKIPLTTKYNILNRGITLLSKSQYTYQKFDFEKNINLKKVKIENDLNLLKIAGFPESAGFLGMILLNIGYLLLLKQKIIPSCWKEIKIYLQKFFKEINQLYPYYLKFEKQRAVEEEQLILNKEEYILIEKKVFHLWKMIKQKKFSIPPYIKQAM